MKVAKTSWGPEYLCRSCKNTFDGPLVRTPSEAPLHKMHTCKLGVIGIGDLLVLHELDLPLTTKTKKGNQTNVPH